jgi:hypothetical protein
MIPTMSKMPNPQGKGLVPLLDSLAACRPQIDVPAKRIEQVTRELFTSLFVLESEFQFRPVVGRGYWLYRKGERFRLSLVAPREWAGNELFGEPVGECVLQPDLTWTLLLTEAAAAERGLLATIDRRRQALEQRLRDAQTVTSALPVFEAQLPFYQRALAAGLAHSLGISLQRGGLAALSYERALLALGNDPQDTP